MSVAEWADIYGIHYWRILWSSYRKLAWVGFEPATTEFRSYSLTDWAIRPWVQLALRINLLQLLQFHRLFSATFHYIRQVKRFFIYNSWQTLNFESTYKEPPFTKVAIFSDTILVSNFRGCKREATSLISHYLIDIIYKSVKTSHLEKL